MERNWLFFPEYTYNENLLAFKQSKALYRVALFERIVRECIKWAPIQQES